MVIMMLGPDIEVLFTFVQGEAKEKQRDVEKKKKKPAAVRMKMVGVKVENFFIRM